MSKKHPVPKMENPPPPPSPKAVLRAKTNTFCDNKGLGICDEDNPGYLDACSNAFTKAYSKPVPWLVILFGNPQEWYRKRVIKYLNE